MSSITGIRNEDGLQLGTKFLEQVGIYLEEATAADINVCVRERRIYRGSQRQLPG